MKEIQRPSDAAPGGDVLHTGLFAKPGEGKSHAANEMHKDTDCASIYFNYPEKEADDYEVAGYEIDGYTPKKDIIEAIEQGMELRYKPNPDMDIASQELKQLYECCKEATGEVIILVDEAHMFDQKILSVIILDGRGHKVRFVVITQYPDNLGKHVIMPLEEEIHFGLSPRQEDYFKHHGLPFEVIDERTQEKYAAVVYSEDGEVSQPFKFPSP